ncbi:MAG: hypothetical protein IPK76_07745 [Lewinellaceae bacterium]|nr:hypothetical protein [Lewinellaceae bacterium]
MKKYWYWLLPALVWYSCASSKKVTYAPDQLLPAEKSVFWKISGNGLKKPSYLYGTIHLIPKKSICPAQGSRCCAGKCAPRRF